MPGKHTARQKRQAKHVADTERARGVDPKMTEVIGKGVPHGGYVATPNPIKKLRHLPDSIHSQSRYSGKRGKEAVARVDAKWVAEGKPKINITDKSIQIISLDAYYDSVVKARAAGQHEGGEKTRLKKFPRDLSPTARMRPVSDDEAADQLRKESRGNSKKKSMGWLDALKALATGYTKVSGGGALKASNRPTTSSKKSPKAVDSGGAAELSN